jgi:hypothetical protein
MASVIISSSSPKIHQDRGSADVVFAGCTPRYASCTVRTGQRREGINGLFVPTYGASSKLHPVTTAGRFVMEVVIHVRPALPAGQVRKCSYAPTYGGVRSKWSFFVDGCAIKEERCAFGP